MSVVVIQMTQGSDGERERENGRKKADRTWTGAMCTHMHTMHVSTSLPVSKFLCFLSLRSLISDGEREKRVSVPYLRL